LPNGNTVSTQCKPNKNNKKSPKEPAEIRLKNETHNFHELSSEIKAEIVDDQIVKPLRKYFIKIIGTTRSPSVDRLTLSRMRNSETQTDSDVEVPKSSVQIQRSTQIPRSSTTTTLHSRSSFAPSEQFEDLSLSNTLHRAAKKKVAFREPISESEELRKVVLRRQVKDSASNDSVGFAGSFEVRSSDSAVNITNNIHPSDQSAFVKYQNGSAKNATKSSLKVIYPRNSSSLISSNGDLSPGSASTNSINSTMSNSSLDSSNFSEKKSVNFDADNKRPSHLSKSDVLPHEYEVINKPKALHITNQLDDYSNTVNSNKILSSFIHGLNKK